MRDTLRFSTRIYGHTLNGMQINGHVHHEGRMEMDITTMYVVLAQARPTYKSLLQFSPHTSHCCSSPICLAAGRQRTSCPLDQLSLSGGGGGGGGGYGEGGKRREIWGGRELWGRR